MRTLLTCLLSFAIALAAVPAFAAIDAYLWIDGVRGDSAKPGRAGWIDISSFSVGVPRANAGAGSGAGASAGRGKTSLSTITIVKRVDKASPLLHEAASAGKAFKVANLEIAKDPAQQPYLQITLNNVFVTGYTVTPNSAAPEEKITFTYGSMKMQYRQQKPDATYGEWSLVAPEQVDKVLPAEAVRYVDTVPPREETAVPHPK
jgi:type VI secretion system secreted protein Hcp